MIYTTSNIVIDGTPPRTAIPAAILPPDAAQHVVPLDDWQWSDPSLERWTRQQFPQALERRCREFAAGRVCAAAVIHALTGAAVQPHDIARTADGAPAWPPAVVGSLAHSRHLAGAVARRRTDAMGIGLDIEPILPDDRARKVARRVGTPEELAVLQHAAGLPHATAVTLTFCAKEALFKCLHPLAGTMFHLSDARLDTASGWDDVSSARPRWTGRLEFELLVDLSAGLRAGRRFGASVAIDTMPASDTAVAYAVVSI